MQGCNLCIRKLLSKGYLGEGIPFLLGPFPLTQLPRSLGSRANGTAVARRGWAAATAAVSKLMGQIIIFRAIKSL